MDNPNRREFLLGMTAQLAFLAAGCATRPATRSRGDGKVDTILYRGRIYTVDPANSVAEAVAIKDGRFVAVGQAAEIRRLATPGTRQIDLAGRTVVPGFSDGHPHLDGVGMNEILPSFDGVRSIDDVLGVLAKEAARRRPGQWIVCTPLANEPAVFKFPDALRERRWPNRHDLDRVTPEHPVFIRPPLLVAPGYAFANTRALRLAGITRDTAAPDAVEILKDEQGEPTGVIADRNFPKRIEANLFRVIPSPSQDEVLRGVRAGLKVFNQAGVTSIYEGHGLATGPQRAYMDLWAQGSLSVRTYFVIAYPIPLYQDTAAGDAVLREAAKYAGGHGVGDDVLKLGGLGFSFDSAAAIGACLMHEPYLGAQGRMWHGVQYTPDENFKSIMMKGARANLRMQVQCSGDAAIDKVLAIFEEVNREIPIADKRWVIEHCQFPSADNITNCKKLGVIPTTGTNFLWKYGHIYQKSFGAERTRNAIPLPAWVDAGVPVVQSTDGRPCEPVFTFWQSLARCDGHTGQALGGQKLTRTQALRIYTINPAYAMFWEDRLGSIEPGKLADLVVLSDDIMQIPEERILETKVLATLVGGRAVHDTGLFPGTSAV
jgi:predicted amidohydrolase YtcJ